MGFLKGYHFGGLVGHFRSLNIIHLVGIFLVIIQFRQSLVLLQYLTMSAHIKHATLGNIPQTHKSYVNSW